MEQDIVFSVIIPTYNRRELLDRCLQSVYQNSYDKCEIIVVDDGSTDDTESFIKKEYPYVNYIRQKNMGVSAARNTGMKIARGDFIAFLDSDDTWYSHRLSLLEKIINVLPESVGLIVNDMDKLIENKSNKKSYITDYFGLEIGSYIKDLPGRIHVDYQGEIVNVSYGTIYNKLVSGNIIQPSCAIISADVFAKFGGFNEEYTVAEDSEYFLRISKFKDFAYVPIILTSLDPPSLVSLSNPKNNILKIRNTIEYINKLHDEEYDHYTKEQITYRLSSLYIELGYNQITNIDQFKARENIIKSILINKIQYKAYLMLLLSYFPSQLLRFLRKLKKQLVHIRKLFS